MIDYLRGLITFIESDYIVIDVNGMGYRVFCANPYAFQGGSEAEKQVFIHYHVREDAILLFGFADRAEQSLFRKLLDVSGIGPRVALGILSGGRPEALIAAIYNEDLAYLTRLPGIGKKTAQRMILDLKDKLDMSGIGLLGEMVHVAQTGSGSSRVGEGTEALQSAKEGLLSLGFTEAEIAKVWTSVKATSQADDSVDAVMKTALQLLYKG
jgi:Holliday junction DNA helicase RuvA